MTPEEAKAAVTQMQGSVDAVKKLATDCSKEVKDGIAALEAKLAAITPGIEEKAVKDMIEEAKAATQKQIDDILEERKNNPSEPKFKSFRAAVKGAMDEKAADIKAFLDTKGSKGGIVLDIKAVTVGIENTDLAVGSASHYLLTHNTGIISRIRKRVLTYLQNVSVGSMDPSKPVAMWVEELDESGTPIFIGEGDDKTELSVRYEEREARARKIGVFTKVTYELIRYLPQFVSLIQNNLMRRVDIKTEDQLFNGDGNGDNLKGVMEYATAFDGGGLAGTIQNANIYDVLRAVVLQVSVAYGVATGIWVHPSTVAQMDLSKDLEGRYLLPPFIREDGKVISGMRIIETTALNAGEFVGGELDVINVYFTDGMTVQLGMDGNDFTKNKKTLLVEQELVQFVSANDTQVLVQGDFETAIEILQAP